MSSSVGLDIGWDCIKAVEIDSSLWISKYAKIEIPRPFDGDESELYKKKITELFNEHEFSRDNVTTNLRGACILARSYSPPSSKNADFEQWFVDNIESLIPGTPIEDVFYDYQFLNTGRVLISFARLRPLQNQIAVLKSCGIIPKAIDASCLALHHLYQNHSWTVKKRNYAILDIGGFTSDLLIMKEGVPFATIEITFGSKYLKKGKRRFRIFSQELARSLQKAITYYQENEELIIDGLIVLGDCADAPGLRTNIKRILGIRAQIAMPQEVSNGFINNDGHCYARAVGLALKGLNCNPGINMMTPEAKEARKSLLFDKRAKKIFKKNVIFSTIIFAVLAFALFSQVKDYTKLRSHLDLLTDNRNALMKTIAEEKALNAKYNELNRLTGNRFFWSRLLYNVGYAIPPGLYLTDINTESRMVSGGKNIQSKKKIVIKGQAHSSETVITFVQNLEKHFSSIVVDEMKEESGCEFRISVVL
jgi:Tfp pilus assembly PilM family ATPase